MLIKPSGSYRILSTGSCRLLLTQDSSITTRPISSYIVVFLNHLETFKTTSFEILRLSTIIKV